MLYKLLKHKISTKQLLSFAFVNIIGLTIVFLGFQIYKDIKPAVSGEDKMLDGEYIVLTKSVSTVGSLLGSNGFSKNEIKMIKSKDFIEDAAPFETSLFNVRAGINLPNITSKLSTDLFFEAIPDEFIDVKSDNWTFDSDKKVIPIILPKSYLDLYNFGFATSKKLPQLSESTINSINLTIRLSSPTHPAEHYDGYIVGFSKRINTILVPLDFLQKANEEFAQQKSSPTRVIIKVNDAKNRELLSFINDKKYEIDGNQLDGGKGNYILQVITGIVLSIGMLICILSCYILVLSIYLLLEKNLVTLENLALLGYSRSQIAQPYNMLIIISNAFTFILSLLVVFMIRLAYLPTIKKVLGEYGNLSMGLDLATFALALFSFILLTFISIRMIKARIKKATQFI